MKETHYTYCRNCTAQCGLKVEVQGNTILSVAGDRDHPLSRGYLCIKGLASKDHQNGEDRNTTALVGRAALQKSVATPQALDAIAAKLSAIVDRHGSSAIGLYYGTGANFNALAHSAMKGWLHSIGSPYIFSSMTLDQSAKWVAMGRMGFFAAGQHSISDADVGLLVGMNPVISHSAGGILDSANPAQAMRNAKAHGVKLIVVDPRFTETARQADLHLQIRPGEDATLFAGLIRLVLDRGWENRSFCARFVAPLDGLRAAVEPFELAYVARRTGIPAECIERAADWFAHAKRPTAATGTGPNMGPQSNLAEHMVRVFNAICGGYRRAGDAVRNPGFLFGPKSFSERVQPPDRTWERGPKLRTHDVGRLFGEYPTALLPDEIIGRGEDRLRALIVVGGNPVTALVDPKRTLSAFERLDLLVTLDSRRTETTDRSDYVIPTTLPYERFDLTAMFDHYNSAAYAKVAHPIVDAPADVIDDWQFFWKLTRRMNRQLTLKRPMFGVAHEDIPGPSLTLASESAPTSESLVRWIASSFGAATYEDLIANPHGVVRSDLATTVQAAAADDGARLEVMPSDVAQDLASLRESGPVSEFKYRLIVRRALAAMNSAYRNSSKMKARHPLNHAFMNPLDMADEGLAQDDALRIASRHGVVVARARRDPGLLRGCISMTHQWGSLDVSQDPQGNAGAFTGHLCLLGALETINYMPLQSGIPVNVRPRGRIVAAAEEP